MKIFLNRKYGSILNYSLILVLLIVSIEVYSNPSLGSISTNLDEYSDAKLPRYSKLELTFDVSTVADNKQFPYDATTPAGLIPEQGVTVNALFTNDNWTTSFTQPAFLFEVFDHEFKKGRDWVYPTGQYQWKVRFSPNSPGEWKYKITVLDKEGSTESSEYSFTVVPSAKRGFVRVSKNDSRYFEFDNGEFFQGLGYHFNYKELDWDNLQITEQKMQHRAANNVQLARTWLSWWGIYSSAWNSWYSPLQALHGLYIPDPSMTYEYAYPGNDVSMALSYPYNPGMMLGNQKATPAVKRNTRYQLTIRYFIPEAFAGPRDGTSPYGLVAKIFDNMPMSIEGYANTGTGTIVSEYASNVTSQWSTLTGIIDTGENDYLKNFYLVLENIDTTAGTKAFIDKVEIREDFGDGTFGPNIVHKPSMAHHLYFEQRGSYMFDRTLELAEENGIYLKLVLQEKSEWIYEHIDHDGNMAPRKTNIAHSYFYGKYRTMTKTRWLQQAWWRYCQARWGYSPSIHSWEMINRFLLTFFEAELRLKKVQFCSQ